MIEKGRGLRRTCGKRWSLEEEEEEKKNKNAENSPFFLVSVFSNFLHTYLRS